MSRCVPYRYRNTEEASSIDEVIEVLVINAQNGKGMLFPKGGWEKDESMEEAAIRETLEEAGVLGSIEVSIYHTFFFFFFRLNMSLSLLSSF